MVRPMYYKIGHTERCVAAHVPTAMICGVRDEVFESAVVSYKGHCYLDCHTYSQTDGGEYHPTTELTRPGLLPKLEEAVRDGLTFSAVATGTDGTSVLGGQLRRRERLHDRLTTAGDSRGLP